MILKHAGTSKLGPAIDERLSEGLTIATTTEIPQNIAFLLDRAIHAVADQLEDENLLNNVMPVQILVTDRDEITLQFLEEELATVISVINYPIQRWINKELSEIKMLVCIVEEFAHFYWDIRDEVEVNYKVLEICKRIVPDISMNTLYNEEWMERNK